MKIVHLSDLHLGIKLHKKDLYEDQAFILKQIVRCIREEAPDAVVIAGDIFDTSQPQDSAKSLYDWLVGAIYKENIPLYIISGNHDPVELLNMCSGVLAESRVFVASKTNAQLYKYSLQDEYGSCNIYLMPYMKASFARAAAQFTDEEKAKIQSLSDAVSLALQHADINYYERNILVTHQFIQGARVNDTAKRPVGGLIGLEAELFAGFDYVALGHLHTPHNAVSGSHSLRYSGTPLKYSFDETAIYDLEKQGWTGNQGPKSLTVVELGPKGTEPVLRTVPLYPLRELVTVRGKLDELLKEETIANFSAAKDYFRFILTDKDYQENAQKRLSAHYRHVLNLKYEAIDRSIDVDYTELEGQARLTPLDYVKALYKEQFGEEMSAEDEKLALEILGKDQV